jgi:hypothetical protein
MPLLPRAYPCRSTSADPRNFRAAGSSFSAGKTYNFTVNVSDNTGQWTSDVAYVSVSRPSSPYDLKH